LLGGRELGDQLVERQESGGRCRLAGGRSEPGGQLGGEPGRENVGEVVETVHARRLGSVRVRRRRIRLGRRMSALVLPVGEGELSGRGGLSLPARMPSRSRSASRHCLTFSDAEEGKVADKPRTVKVGRLP